MMKSFSYIFFIAFCINLQAYECRFDLPLLVIKGNQGKVNYIPFKFSQERKSGPLRISISDDSPNGTGNSIRACVWKAATTAAILRNELISDIRISLEFSGLIDGPSAGSMICLAIMSAMDQKPFPKDFAMTGTIMPDGSVGLVGGVAQKIKAAAKQGIKRICVPAFLRFEKQLDGSEVDIYRTGDKFGIQVYPVEHISDAYTILHNLPKKNYQILSATELCRLPTITENELIRQYNKYHALVKKEISSLKNEELKQIESEKISADWLLPRNAELMFSTGKLLAAVDSIEKNYVFLRARKNNIQLIEEIKIEKPSIIEKLGSNRPKTQVEGLLEYDQLFKYVLKKFQEQYYNNELQYVPGTNKIGDISAQMESGLEISSSIGVLKWLDLQTTFEGIDELKTEDMVKYIEMMAHLIDLKFFFLWAIEQGFNQNSLNRVPIVKTITQMTSNRYAKEVEQLFYSGFLANHNAIKSEIISEIVDIAKCSTDNANNILIKTDLYYSIYLSNIEFGIKLHALCENENQFKNKSYHRIVSMFALIDLFVQSSAILVKYGPEIQIDKDQDGNIYYKNTHIIHYLIRNAREYALRCIAECRRLKIPCLSPITNFEIAEINRDKSDSDKIHDVLVYYWKSSLESKALIMSFKKRF